MTRVEELNEAFGMPGVLAFEDHAGMPRARVTMPGCTATVYLHGAQVTAWQPVGTRPVLFLSDKSAYAQDKAIRGGIPICFPWFGDRSDGFTGPAQNPVKSPAHGFARIEEWEFVSALLMPGTPNQAVPERSVPETLRLVLRLGPSEQSRALGFDAFLAVYEVVLGGRELTAKLSVVNGGPEPLRIEEALHTYLAVADVRSTTLTGLEGAMYLDKTDGFKAKHAPDGPLGFAATTDRVFPGHTGGSVVQDAERTIMVSKEHSAATVVWNPWLEGSANLKDMEPEAWTGFLCVETANVGADAVTIAPGQGHTMTMTLSVAY